jgi:lysophospholipid acyltransferase (LPLAT)-like uncharacterized protein
MTGAVGALGASVASAAVRLLGVTLRVTFAGVDDLARRWAAGAPVIYAVWHGRILMVPWLHACLARTHGARPVTVLVSRSSDGEIVARYIHRFGLAAVRGSSSRGGAEAARALVARLRQGADVAVIPDGPRGPRGRVQPGVVALAALSGVPIVPLAVAARPRYRLSSWDEFMIPAPFGRCAMAFGMPIHVARDADRAQAAKEIERSLGDVTTAADRLVGA